MKLIKSNKFKKIEIKENFSSNVKKELIENILKNIKNIKNDELDFLLLGFFITRNMIIDNKIYMFKNINIRKIFFRILKNKFLNINWKSYTHEDIKKINLNIKDTKKKLIDIMFKSKKSEEEICKIKYVIISSFLSSGYISDPKSQYNLEIFKYIKDDEFFILNILEFLDINFKEFETEEYKKYYIRKGDDISKVLAFMGSSKGVLNLEEERVIKTANQQYNRALNFEFSNISKTLMTSEKQIKAIKKIEREGIKLDEKLKEAANLRKKYNDLSLKELSEKSGISKSTLNSRLKKIEKIADEI